MTASRADVARVLARLDEIEVVVEKLVAGGDGLARVKGVPIFVPRSAPGDRVRVKIEQRRPDYGRARILELLEPGPGRRPPPCPHFEACGGCDLQHLEDERQTALKVAAALETLRRLGRLEALPEARVIRGRAWAYRLRTQLRTEVSAERVDVGYFARGSHTLVPVDVCPILVPELESVLQRLPSLLSSPPRRLDLAAGDGGRVTVAPPVEGLPGGPVSRRIAGFSYEYDARVFFQAHAGLLDDLVRETCGPWTGAAAVDLFAGVGLFSLPLARHYGNVVAVESDRVACRYARRNARSAGLDNLEVATRSAESWMAGRAGGALERVVVDPPRTGMSRRLRRMLLACRPRRLTVVSCHPATLARDLRDLCPTYSLDGLAFLDIFPQSGHIETVAQLAIESS